jgi:phosphoribosylglycinamide formyltransferase-1
MVAIAKACAERRIGAQMAIVIADRADAKGLSLAQEMGIPAQVVPWPGAAQRESFEQALHECIDAHHPDLVILAGFMRVLSAPFVERYSGRMLNIHPSLLPKHVGLHTHRRVLEAGDRQHGASVHFVTAELDSGPVVLQARVPVHADDTETSLAARVQVSEHLIYPRVIGWIAEGRLAWSGGQPIFDGTRLEQPFIEDLLVTPG